MNPVRWWRRWRTRRACFHHDPSTGTTWITATFAAPLTWCTVCDKDNPKCRHHDPHTGTSWVVGRLIDTGRSKLWWCTRCGRNLHP